VNEQGKVVEQRPDGTVVIEVRRGAACEGCRAQNACGMGTHASSIKVVARNALGATVGQTVTLELDDSAFLAACAWVYGVPVIGLLVGAAAGFLVAQAMGYGSHADAFGAAGSLIGLGLCAAAVWLRDRAARDAHGVPTGRFQVRIRAFAEETPPAPSSMRLS